MKRILITGANGKLGSRIVKNLKSDFTTIPVSRMPKTSDALFYSDLVKGIAMQKGDCIIHCAFPLNQNADEVIYKNAIEEFEEMLNNAVKCGVEKFINISSQSVYGEFREKPSLERDICKAENLYAKAKVQCEILGEKITKGTPLHYTNIRLASLVSPDIPLRIINKMAKRAILESIIQVVHSKNIFGYMDTDDAADGLCEFLKNSNSKKWNSVYNLGTIPNENETAEFIAKTIFNLCVKFGDIPKMEIISTDANIRRWMRSERFYKASSWMPQIKLEDAIRKIFMNELQLYKLGGG